MGQAVDSGFNPETTKIIPVSIRKVGGGRFTLRREVGRGGMGVVWLAHDEELSVNIALKFLPELVALDREALEDLKRETRRSRQLAHKNIVKVYHFESKDGRAAIAMEYVDGQPIGDYCYVKERRSECGAALQQARDTQRHCDTQQGKSVLPNRMVNSLCQ